MKEMRFFAKIVIWRRLKEDVKRTDFFGQSIEPIIQFSGWFVKGNEHEEI